MSRNLNLKFDEQHLQIAFGNLYFPMEESDWKDLQPSLDIIHLRRKQLVAHRTKRFIIFTVILLTAAGFFSFVLLKERIFPQGGQKNAVVAIPAVDEQYRGEKIFTEVFTLDMEPRKVVEKQPVSVAEAPKDSAAAVFDEKEKSTAAKRDSATTGEKRSVSKKTKKDSKQKKSKKKSKNNPAKHSSKDDEVIISE